MRASRGEFRSHHTQDPPGGGHFTSKGTKKRKKGKERTTANTDTQGERPAVNLGGEHPPRRIVLEEDSAPVAREGKTTSPDAPSSSSNAPASPPPGETSLEGSAGASLGGVMDEEWAEQYKACQTWSSTWEEVQEGQKGGIWPKGIHWEQGKLYKGNKLLVPEGLT